MRRQAGPLLLLASVSCWVGGCASAGLGRGGADADQVQALEQRVVELQRKAAVNEVELDRLRRRVAELEARQGIAPAPSTSSRFVPPSSSSTPLPLPPPAPPSARQGSTTAPPASAAPRAASPRATAPATPSAAPIEERDIDIPATGAPSAGAAPPAGGGGARRADGAAEAVTPAIQALYDRGYTLYHQGHFVDAEASFQRFLQAHPTSELADNAQYWIGECRYSRGDFRGALAAFRETVARYPEGSKVPDALLKAGLSLEKLGDVEGARAMYREVIFRFPQTAVAAVAQERRSKLP